MTQGQIIFLAGAALLALTVILAIIFAIAKPRYTPEQVQGKGTDDPAQAMRQRTVLLTGQAAGPSRADTELAGQTVLSGQTELTDQAALGGQTELVGQTVLSGQTELVEDATELLEENT